jgi:hypothetical protein
MTLQAKYESAPTGDTQFDAWLGERRAKLLESATAAGLKIPDQKDNPAARSILMLDPSNESAADVRLHRAYRLRQLALLEETVAILSRKYGRQQVSKFENDPLKPEPAETVEVGPIALEQFSIVLPKDLAERRRNTYEEALKRGGRPAVSDRERRTPSELPYSVTGLDITFLTPLQTVPSILQALETSQRYRAVLSRVDFQRASAPFPSAGEGQVAAAGPVRGINTHYQEAPVRVTVTLHLLEYDKSKEAPSTPEKKK